MAWCAPSATDEAELSRGTDLHEEAIAQYRAGMYAEAEAKARENVAIRTRILGETHEGLAPGLNLLGMVLNRQGKSAEARPIYERSLAIMAASDPDDPDVAAVLNNLARVLEALGEVDEARAMHHRSVAIRETHPDATPLDLASSLNNLALLETASGNWTTARQLLERGLAIRESELGPDHVAVATTVNSLGMLLHNQGDYGGARHQFARALEIREAELGPEHPFTAVSLNNLAATLHQLREFEAAIPLYIRALELGESQVGPDHPDIAPRLNNLAAALKETGKREAALGLYERSLAIREAHFGPDHPAVGNALANLAGFISYRDVARSRALYERSLAIVAATRGTSHPKYIRRTSYLASLLTEDDNPAGRKLHRAALASTERFMNELLPSLSEREAMSFVADNREVLDKFLAAHDGPQDGLDAWSAVLAWKGAVARTLAARPVTDERLKAARRELAKQTLAGASVDRLDELIAERDGLEREIASTDAALQTELDLRQASATEICAALPPDSTLVDYVRYARRDLQMYLAFVVDAVDCSVTATRLGKATEIDGLIAEHRATLVSGGLDQRVLRRGEALADAVWTPIASALSDRVILVPDGELASVAFGALPDGDGFLAERIHLSYLESATDLVRWTHGSAEGEGALIVGGVTYGAGPGPTCLGEPFAALPGTATEADVVRKYLRRDRPSVLKGADASEAAAVAAMPSKRVVHLATHGFFAQGRCAEPGMGFDAMSVSGLALAAANTPTAASDGILTAAEVGTLDLSRAELVVLSACETGVGEARSGEGVLGLRRGFTASGARTLVMSLWSVSDAGTSELMTEFYRHLRRVPASEALWKAQRSTIARNRETGNVSWDWAAFVASGDWR